MDEPRATRIRKAETADLPAVADVYLAAFPDTVHELNLRRMSPDAVADLMAVCLAAEPQAFSVAEIAGAGEVETEVVGYAICPLRADRIWRTAILRGHVLRMLWRLLTCRYGIGLRSFLGIAADKLNFWRGQRLREAKCDARILSIAVAPAAQGQGIGRLLLHEGLDYLRSQGATCVRLEVRPENTGAEQLYESLGFCRVGVIEDTRGAWEVMMLKWEPGDNAPD